MTRSEFEHLAPQLRARSGTVESNLDVEALRRNQKLFEYRPRVVVE